MKISNDLTARNLPEPFELFRAILSSPGKLSLEVLSQLLGTTFLKEFTNSSAVQFLVNLESNLKSAVKSPENCYLGTIAFDLSLLTFSVFRFMLVSGESTLFVQFALSIRSPGFAARARHLSTEKDLGCKRYGRSSANLLLTLQRLMLSYSLVC